MSCWSLVAIIAVLASSGTSRVVAAPAADPRLREIVYDAGAVVTVPVKRGIVTHILLDPDEVITDVASGLGSDCAKPDSAWCVAAQVGGRSLFVKPKSGASVPNNLAVVTDKRTHSFVFVVLPEGDARPPVYRLVLKTPVVARVVALRTVAVEAPAQLAIATGSSSAELVAERLLVGPNVINTSYSIAEGEVSEDIVPTLVFDDGRFTYFRFPGNREVPAVFHVLGDGTETLVNTRMEDDLLVVDRVSRRLMLRSGSAVVGVWNEAFDLDGAPSSRGATVPGVERVVKADAPASGRLQLRQGNTQ